MRVLYVSQIQRPSPMPVRGYQLRFSGGLTCTRTSVKGCKNAAVENIELVLHFTPCCHPPTLSFNILTCDSHEESMLTGRHLLRRTVNREPLSYGDSSSRASSIPLLALTCHILRAMSIPSGFSSHFPSTPPYFIFQSEQLCNSSCGDRHLTAGWEL